MLYKFYTKQNVGIFPVVFPLSDSEIVLKQLICFLSDIFITKGDLSKLKQNGVKFMYLDEFNTVTDEMDNFDDALKARDAMRRKTSRRRKNEIKKKNRRKNIVKAFGKEAALIKKTKKGDEYVQFAKNSKRQSYLKKQTHRRNRRKPIEEDDFALKGNHYRRSLDYAWELD